MNHGRSGDRQHDLFLSPKAVRDGVWIDVGQWSSTRYGHELLEASLPVVMRRDQSYTEGQARDRGWLL